MLSSSGTPEGELPGNPPYTGPKPGTDGTNGAAGSGGRMVSTGGRDHVGGGEPKTALAMRGWPTGDESDAAAELRLAHRAA